MSDVTLFRDSVGYDSELAKAAMVAARDVLAVSEGERALIVTNPDSEVLLVSQAVFDAIHDLGGIPTMAVQTLKTQVDEANPEVLSAFNAEPHASISISAEKLGKDPRMMKSPFTAPDGREYTHIFDKLLHGTKVTKAFWSPSITVDMFKRTVPIDYALLRERCTRLKDIMDRADEIHVTSPGGTDMIVAVKGRSAEKDDGDFTAGGLGGNLPAGEVYISPALDASRGVIAFDGSISSHKGEIIIKDTIDCIVENGHITDIRGGEDAELLKESIAVGERMAREFGEAGKLPRDMVEHYVRNANNIGELGIGLNPQARIVGNMLEDEKVLSTCHLAVGANYDEDAKAMIHLDGLVQNPTITARFPDGSTAVIMENGKLAE